MPALTRSTCDGSVDNNNDNRKRTSNNRTSYNNRSHEKNHNRNNHRYHCNCHLSVSFSLLSADPSLVERVRAGMPGTHSYFHSFPPFSHAHSPPRELPNLAQSSPTTPRTLPQTSPRAPQLPELPHHALRSQIIRVLITIILMIIRRPIAGRSC